MKLPRMLFAGALLTIVVAALVAQDDSPGDPTPSIEEQPISVPVEAVVADQQRTSTLVRLNDRQPAAVSSILNRIFEKQLKEGRLIIEREELTNSLLISGERKLAGRAAEIVGAIDRFRFTPIPIEEQANELRKIVRSFSPETVSAKGLIQSLQEVDSQQVVELTQDGGQIRFVGWDGRVNDLVDLAERLDERATVPGSAGSEGTGLASSDELAQEPALPEDKTRRVPPHVPSDFRSPTSPDQMRIMSAQRGQRNVPAGDANPGMMSSMAEMMRAMPAGQPPADLSRQFRDVDEESVRLARSFRELAEREPASPQLQFDRQNLINSVTEAFDSRQRWQQAEVTRLRDRLKNLERTISSRQNARTQIIERRVADLINPEQRWGDGAANSDRSPQAIQAAAMSRPTAVIKRPWRTLRESQVKAWSEGKPFILLIRSRGDRASHKIIEELWGLAEWRPLESRVVWLDIEAESPEGRKALNQFGIEEVPQVIVFGPDLTERARIKDVFRAVNLLAQIQSEVRKMQPGSTGPQAARRSKESDMEGDVGTSNRGSTPAPSGSGVDSESLALIDAVAALEKARVTLAESESSVATHKANLERWKEISRKEPNRAASAHVAEEALQGVQAEKRRAEDDLKTAIRHERQARLALETRIKLLQLDRDSAVLNLEQANREASRAVSLYERSAISREEGEGKETARKLAKLALDRAETLLNAAVQALKTADEQGQSTPPSDSTNAPGEATRETTPPRSE